MVTRYTKKNNKTAVSIKTHVSLTHRNCSIKGKTSSWFLSPSRDCEICRFSSYSLKKGIQERGKSESRSKKRKLAKRSKSSKERLYLQCFSSLPFLLYLHHFISCIPFLFFLNAAIISKYKYYWERSGFCNKFLSLKFY